MSRTGLLTLKTCAHRRAGIAVCPPACVGVMETCFSPVGQGVRTRHLTTATKHTYFTGKFHVVGEVVLKEITQNS